MSSGRILLGVAGGIACYKAAEVLRGFQRAGLEVRVAMSANATRFVGVLTFEALSGHPVSWGGLGGGDGERVPGVRADGDMAHVEITRGARLFVAAPATANLIAKLAHGIADDWLTTSALACTCPMLLAPAMNQRMWANPAVQANLALLRSRGATIVPPSEGDLACGEVGPGRLADPEAIVAAGLLLLGAGRAWAGRRVLVTSGPTHEDLDPVRYLANKSSGKMGHALAAVAAEQGADVVLVSGPVALPDPEGCRVVPVRSAEQMAEAVAAELAGVDAAFFAAAVADFRPRAVEMGKIKRAGRDSLQLELERTRDLLAEAVARRTGALIVGFAAETEGEALEFGRRKLEAKGCDLLVANRVGGERCVFGADESEAVLVGPGDFCLELSRAAKGLLAERILSEVLKRLQGGDPQGLRPGVA